MSTVMPKRSVFGVLVREVVVRSKWNHRGLHVSKPFGLVQIEADRLSAWVTLPVLWRAGLRFGRREFTIDRTRSAYHHRWMASLYVPVDGGEWIRTSIGVEARVRSVGVVVQAGKPPE